ncbi:unnamed protein product, partial [Laminaria digitata]
SSTARRKPHSRTREAVQTARVHGRPSKRRRVGRHRQLWPQRVVYHHNGAHSGYADTDGAGGGGGSNSQDGGPRDGPGGSMHQLPQKHSSRLWYRWCTDYYTEANHTFHVGDGGSRA